MSVHNIGRPIPEDYDGEELYLCPIELDRAKGRVVFPTPVPAEVKNQIVQTLQTVDFDAWRQQRQATALAAKREEKIEANRLEARRRIAQVLGLSPDVSVDKLLAKEANMLMQAIDAVAAGDTGAISSMRAIKQQIDAIRAAENTAAEQIMSALTIEDVDAVNVNWP